jgi:hypothetical protein
MRRASIITCSLLLTFAVPAGLAVASPDREVVTGVYRYHINDDEGNSRLVTVLAIGKEGVANGVWSWAQPVPGGSRAFGTITCLNVDGPDAWLAGPVKWASVGPPWPPAVFMWIRDGGLPGGGGDEAITWIADSAFHDLAAMNTLCEAAATSFDEASMAALGLSYEPGMETLHREPLAGGNLRVIDDN